MLDRLLHLPLHVPPPAVTNQVSSSYIFNKHLYGYDAHLAIIACILLHFHFVQHIKVKVKHISTPGSLLDCLTTNKLMSILWLSDLVKLASVPFFSSTLSVDPVEGDLSWHGLTKMC